MNGLVERFRASMAIDAFKGRDGEGYDLSALDGMTAAQLAEVERIVLERGVTDWRDLEVLDRLATPAAHVAILLARKSDDRELRLAAQEYGPRPAKKGREGAILDGLQGDLYDSLFRALDLAVEHPTPRVVAALLRCARDRGGPGGYGAVAALFTIHRKIGSPDDWTYRPLFLRIADMDSRVRRAAFTEACRILGVEEPRWKD